MKTEIKRESYIGGNDAGAICGLSPYQKPINVYMRKTGMEDAPETNQAMEMGNYMESVIADLHEKQTGEKLVVPSPKTVLHPQYRFWGGSIDRLIENNPRKGLEIKNVGLRMSHHWGEVETDQAPMYVIGQIVWYMPLLKVYTGKEADEFGVTAFIGGNDFRKYIVHRDFSLEKVMYEKVREFWENNIMKQVPPEADDSEEYKEYLKKMFPKTVLEEIKPSDAEAEVLMESYKAAQEQQAVIEKAMKEIKNKMLAKIGDAQGMAGREWQIKMSDVKGSVSWKKVAENFDVTDEMIVKCTGKGYRKMNIKFNKECE